MNPRKYVNFRDTNLKLKKKRFRFDVMKIGID